MADRTPGVTEEINFAHELATATCIVYPKEEHV